MADAANWGMHDDAAVTWSMQRLFEWEQSLFVRLCLTLCLIVGAEYSAAATVPSAAPQFRVDAPMHTAAIGQIRPDWPRNRVVTLSSDRTVRIWQLPSLQLVRLLRLPQEGSIEGLPIGLAVSPDGETIAVGGWTGISWDKTASIYVYNATTGEMKQRLSGFPDVISALDWSADGRRLAVGLAGRNGVRVLSTSDWQIVAQDLDYQGAVGFLHFSSSGLLASSASDGNVRLYGADNKLAARQPVGVSNLLGGVRFSPDGKLLALGIVDKPIAVLLKVPTLDLVAVRQVTDPKQRGMCCIAWSRDGSALFLNGEHAGEGATPLYRFDNGGLGAPQALPVGDQRFSNMLPLPDGGVLFATTTPSLSVLSASGAVLRTVSSVIGDFRDGAPALRVSAGAQTISFPMARFGAKPKLFSIDTLEELPLDDIPLLPPILSASGFRLEGFGIGAQPSATVSPRLNGQALPLVENDRVLAHAFPASGQAIFVGTTWQVVKLDRDARALWRQSFSSEVRAVNASGDGSFLLVTLADGTVRWLRQSDGREVLALFAHNNGADWVLWRPDGYYASSENGDQFVGWHLNRGVDHEPDFYRAVQFERVFYRPDLVRAALEDERGPQPVTRGLSTLAQELEAIAPARLAVRSTQTRINSKGRVEISMKLVAQARALPMQQLAVYVNGLPVTPSARRPLAGSDSRNFERTLVVESDRADNQIRIEVDQGQSLGMVETYAEFAGAVPKQPPARGRLLVLSVGVNHFINVKDDRLEDLVYAAQDAEEFAKTIETSSRGLFSEVKSTVLTDFTDKKPDKAEIRKALARLEEAGPDDTVVVFLASHAFSDRSGDYFFMNRDGKFDDVLDAVRGPARPDKAPSLMGWREFFDALRKTAGRRMLIVDTCHANNIEGKMDTHSLRKRSAASNFAMMVAAKGKEESQEYEAGKHGLFTYALIQSFGVESDANRDGFITIDEAFAHLKPIVDRLYVRSRTRQTPQLIGSDSLLSQPIAIARP
jgi:hypothetical protein